MTVNEMIERLQEVAEDGFGECDLRLAFQPNWPLQFTVGGIATPDDAYEDEEERESTQEDDAAGIVYIYEGHHPDDSPYAPKWAMGR